jgi:hypothetical protein
MIIFNVRTRIIFLCLLRRKLIKYKQSEKLLWITPQVLWRIKFADMIVVTGIIHRPVVTHGRQKGLDLE